MLRTIGKLKRRKTLSTLITLIFILTLFAPLFLPRKASAIFTEAYLRLDRVKASTTTGGTICAKPATTGTEADVQVVFPTGFTVNVTAANWTVTTTNLPSGATAWVTIGTASAVSGQTVTFPSGDLTVGTLYCFNFAATSTLTNSTAGNNKTGTITTRTITPTTVDATTYAVSIVSDDQVAITATVSQIFSFSLSANTIALGTLSTSAVTSGNMTLTMATNANTGWITWVKSANANLSSATTGSNIATVGTVDDIPSSLAAQAGYVLDVDITTDSATGDGTVSQAAGYGAEYAGADTSSGGALSTTLQPVARSNGTTDGDVLTANARAKVSAVQEPATDYTDTLTFVSTGRF